jgi:hypothetical protein
VVPLPIGLVVKNGAKMRLRCTGAMPVPVSDMAVAEQVAQRLPGRVAVVAPYRRTKFLAMRLLGASLRRLPGRRQMTLY